MISFDHPKLLLFTISGFLTAAVVNAQDAACQNRQKFTNVNSTGQQEFTWNSSYASNDPWYVSVLVGYQGIEWNDSHDVRANAYISVPENVSNGTEICIYQYSNINATLGSGGENSCSAVISSACIDHLNKVLTISAPYCPSSDTASTSEAFNQACPMLKGGSHSTFPPLSLLKPLYAFLLSFTLQILSSCHSRSACFVHIANKSTQAPNTST